ncbi:MAG: glycoside hydrolase family 13 protein [Oscillospiraceae bacterium]|nr:glycoside hydrolase family 13 protein [Oscillospiraceae bacterium]
MIDTLYIFDEDDEYFRYPSGAFETPGTLELSIKLARGSAIGASVYLHPDDGVPEETVMEFITVTGAFDLYKCRITIHTPGLYWYTFHIRTPDGGKYTIPENSENTFQITAHGAAAIAPNWIHGGLIYHIFVDRFHRGGELRLRSGAVFRSDWDGIPYYLPDEEGIVHNNDFFGGDLYGIIEKLPYLEELGVTCIYLSPIFDAASNHKYDTGDYMQIDPAFGGNEAFEELCTKAKDRGMSIILDGVFNHVGIDSRYFNKYGNYDSLGAYQNSDSPYYDWFRFREDGTYESWWDIELLPAVNKSNEAYRDYICAKDGVIAHWTKKGVSGWRLDVVDELPDVFLYPLCAAIKREKGDAIIVGEVWEDASNKIAYDVRRRYFHGGQLDSVTNYPVKNAIIACVKEGNVEQLAATMATLCRNYPEYVLHSLMTVVGSHDTARILTVLSDVPIPSNKVDMEHFSLDDASLALAKQRLKLASVLQFTLPGVPCIYYGDEAGMEGCIDPFNRRGYPWGHEDEDLLFWYKNLSCIRKSSPSFANGAYKLVEARAGLFAFTRGEGKEQILIGVNTTDKDRTINVDGFNVNLLSNTTVDTITLSPGQAGIFACR